MKALLRLYPASWRARYGEEFEALLEERPLGPFDVADVLLAAIDAHLHPRGASARGDDIRGVPMTPRIGGMAAIVGGALWLVSLAAASASQGSDAQPWLTLFVVALFALVVAMVGLSADQGHRKPGLTWMAVAVPIIGAAISAVGWVGMATLGDEPFIGTESPWTIWFLGMITMILGSGLFAIAIMRVPGRSRAGAALLIVGAVAAIPALFGVASTNGPGEIGSALAMLGIFAFAAGWVWLGISAIRTDRAASAALRSAIP